MKKIIIIAIIALAINSTSCTKLEDYNIDSKNATAVPSSSLFTNGLRNLVDQETTPSVNLNVFRPFAQYWTETTYTDESNYDVKSRLIPDFEFRTIFRDVLGNLKEAEKVVAQETGIESTPAEKKNKTAVAEILIVYAFQREVDIFGNVPYDQALDINVLNPAYDDAQAIYAKLFARLDAAIASIDAASAGFTDGDLVYGGDMSKWKTFANCLKLKMAITVADVAALDPQGKAASAIAGGVFTSSADNANFPYLSASPNTNPVYVELVASGRFDWVAANTLVDTMNFLNDPRRSLYFDENLGAGTFVGGPYGENNTYGDYTHVTPTIQTPEYEGVLITYSEIEFYLAEAAARWGIGGSAETHYDNAITASIVDDWGGSAVDAATYLSDPNVAYSSAPGDYKHKIGIQAWIGFYNRGLHGWTTWRRLDYPIFNLPPTATNYSEIPKRLTYPSTEQTLNGSNYTAAAAAIGGDVLTTRLFWDKQ